MWIHPPLKLVPTDALFSAVSVDFGPGWLAENNKIRISPDVWISGSGTVGLVGFGFCLFAGAGSLLSGNDSCAQELLGTGLTCCSWTQKSLCERVTCVVFVVGFCLDEPQSSCRHSNFSVTWTTGDVIQFKSVYTASRHMTENKAPKAAPRPTALQLTKLEFASSWLLWRFMRNQRVSLLFRRVLWEYVLYTI